MHTLTKILDDETDACTPNETVIIRPRDKPEMTLKILHLFLVCRRLHKIAKGTDTEVDREDHRVARSLAKHNGY